jgi:decaprenyl-phosphate phosphoribosyltransferase
VGRKSAGATLRGGAGVPDEPIGIDALHPPMSTLDQAKLEESTPAATPAPAVAVAPRRRPMWVNLVRLARPQQWAKGAFVVVGPVYAIATSSGGAGDEGRIGLGAAVGVLGAVLAFGFASSSCYVINDIRDREADRAHPRKRNRPVASGAVPVGLARAWAWGLLGLAAVAVLLALVPDQSVRNPVLAAGLLAAAVAVYVVNTNLYSASLKHHVVLDVISLAAGFVLRVLGGCAAAGVAPSAWLLNVTFFVSMFLAFGKRLGERRTLGEDAAAARQVQGLYTDELLRMAVVVTGVACLVTYAGYIQDHGGKYTVGFNLLWLTMLPATYGLLRCIVLLEHGEYDDPTELAAQDRPFQVAVGLFVLITMVVMVWVGGGGGVQGAG